MTRNRFYLYWALTFMLIVAIAFAPRYWIPLINGELDVSKAVHWHAVFSVIWILFYFVQVLLISKRKISLHQKLGLGSLVLAMVVFVTGVWVSIDLVERSLAANLPGARPSLLINLTDMLMFAIIFMLGVKNRKRPDKHKRLITLSAIVLMNAGLFRIGRLIVGQGFVAILLAVLLTASMIVVFALLDRRQSGKLHRSVKKIGLIVILIHIVRIPLAVTPVWGSITDWILSLY